MRRYIKKINRIQEAIVTLSPRRFCCFFRHCSLGAKVGPAAAVSLGQWSAGKCIRLVEVVGRAPVLSSLLLLSNLHFVSGFIPKASTEQRAQCENLQAESFWKTQGPAEGYVVITFSRYRRRSCGWFTLNNSSWLANNCWALQKIGRNAR